MRSRARTRTRICKLLYAGTLHVYTNVYIYACMLHMHACIICITFSYYTLETRVRMSACTVYRIGLHVCMYAHYFYRLIYIYASLFIVYTYVYINRERKEGYVYVSRERARETQTETDSQRQTDRDRQTEIWSIWIGA